jgi:hypothetical protein
MTRILALDPGKTHFGWAFVSTEEPDGMEYDIVRIKRSILCTITGKFESLPSLEDQRLHDVGGYTAELNGLLDFLVPNDPSSYIIWERLIPRPKMGMGAAAEITNITVGITIREADVRGIHMFPVTASQWKTWAKKIRYTDHAVDPSRRISLIREKTKKKTKTRKKAETKPDGVSVRGPHAQDALGIALWSYCRDVLKK